MTVAPPPGSAAPPAGSAVRLSAAFGPGDGAPALAAHRAVFPAPLPPDRRPAFALVDAVERSGLRGRGGAGFPTGTKMRSVAARRGPAVVLANGSEGEPVSAKDRMLLTRAPHLVLDGAALAAAAVGAAEVVVGVERGTAALAAVHAAVAERAASEPGGVPVRVLEVPAHYVAGEERALVRLANGGEAKPTAAPPRPFERGIGGRPTLVANVETLAHVATIARWGADWFRQCGTADDPGTALVTVSGAVARPGVFEVPLGLPLPRALDAAGGHVDGVQAVLVGGYYGTWLDGRAAYAADLTTASLGARGASLGCGAVVVLGEGACGLVETAAILAWMARETAGQCGPCVHGLRALADGFAQVAAGRSTPALLAQLHRWCGQVDGRGGCRFPDGGVRLLRSALTVFADDLARHAHGPCAAATRPASFPIPAGGGPWR